MLGLRHHTARRRTRCGRRLDRALAAATAIVVLHLAGGVAFAASEPMYIAPKGPAPISCPFVFVHYGVIQSYPETGFQPCLRDPGTPLWHQIADPPTYGDFGAPIQRTMPAVVDGQRAKGELLVTTPSSLRDQSIGGIGVYTPGLVGTDQWGDRFVLPNYSYDGTPYRLPVTAGGWTVQYTGDHEVLLKIDIDKYAFDRDRYFFFRTTNGEVANAQAVQVDVVIKVPKLIRGTPVPLCSTARTGPGEYRFSSRSTDPSGQTPTATWTFDDGSTQSGQDVTKHFTTPGTHKVTLKVQGPEESATTSCNVTVPWPTLALDLDYPEGKPPFKPNGPVPVRVTVKAVGDAGIGKVENIKFAAGSTHAGMFTITGSGVTFGRTPSVSPAVPAGGFTLLPGESKVFTTALIPTGLGRYGLASQIGGTSPGLNDAGATVNYVVGRTASNGGEVGEALEMTMKLSPESGAQQTELSTEDKPDPVDVTAELTFKNNSPQKLTSLVLEDVSAKSTSKTAGGQDAFAVTRVGGEAIPAGGLSIELPAGGLPSGGSIKRTYVFRAADDVDAQFSASATGTREGGVIDVGAAREDWSLKPKYLLQVKTELGLPKTVGTPLPAGETARIKGTIKNLSGTDELEVGPMYPELSGNAGVMSLTWDGKGSDPEELQLPSEGSVKLKPREEKTFTVRFTTGYSDPAQLEGTNRSGGVRANVKFTPWARATNDKGVTREVKPAEIKARADQLDFHLTIDDSITIPELEPFAFAGAILYGGAQGARNAAASVALAPADLLVFSYTTLRAIAEYQTTMWDAFTDEEKDRFQRDVAALAVEILKRNAEAAALAPNTLFNQVYDAVGDKMDAQAKAWAAGDWTTVVEEYSAVGADAIGQVVLPIAFAKIAKSTAAVAAIKRAQTALQTTFESTVGFKLASVQKIEELGPLLSDIKNGVELSPDQLEVLYGIAPEELAELQRISEKFDFLLTVRSRHASSLEWIKKGAMMKPEAIKIKTVSSLDTKLGYRVDDIGQLVFRKPTPLARWEEEASAGGTLLQYTEKYLDEVGIARGTAERLEATERIAKRIKEWREHAADYKAWSKLSPDGNSGAGFIDVSFNWKGNGIYDGVRKGSGKYVGFRLKKIAGEGEAYVVEMMDHKVGRWVSVTGDIDPISFTLLDGAPLSEAQHADLLDEMVKSPLLRAQHPESATYTGKKPGQHVDDQFKHDGVAFVQNQFKPGEPALQIAPGGHAPRVVRLNSSKSEWNSSRDYHLHFDGGFTYAGTHVPRGAQPIPTTDFAAIQSAQYQQAATRKAQKLSPSPTPGEPTFGSCTITYSNAPTAKPFVLTSRSELAAVKPAVAPSTVPTLEPEPGLTSSCFTDGAGGPPKPSELIVSPMTQVIGGSKPGDTEVQIDESQASAGKSEEQGLRIGQEVVIGAGTDHAEQATITGFHSIIVDRPLRFAHAEGEPIVVISNPPPSVPTPTPPAVIGGGAPGGGGTGGGGTGAGPGAGGASGPGGSTGSGAGANTPLSSGLKPSFAKGRGPTLSGAARRGRTLQCKKGTWTGTATISFGYAWERRSGKRWSAIKKQAKASYKVTTSDRGRQLRCTVAARNGLGTVMASTKAVTVAKR